MIRQYLRGSGLPGDDTFLVLRIKLFGAAYESCDEARELLEAYRRAAIEPPAPPKQSIPDDLESTLTELLGKLVACAEEAARQREDVADTLPDCARALVEHVADVSLPLVERRRFLHEQLEGLLRTAEKHLLTRYFEPTSLAAILDGLGPLSQPSSEPIDNTRLRDPVRWKEIVLPLMAAIDNARTWVDGDSCTLTRKERDRARLELGQLRVVVRSPEIDGRQLDRARAALEPLRADVIRKAVVLTERLMGRDAHVLPDGAVFRDIEDGPSMVVIPAGKFLMGAPEDEEGSADDERPQHEVSVRRFALGRYTVTFDEHDVFCASTGKEKSGDRGWGRGRKPVIDTSWDDAVPYCAWLSERTGQPYRLPSEAEWEYACRARTTTPFWTGATISTDLANYDGNYTYGRSKKGVWRAATVAVDDPGFPANRFGLSHMHGNVWEWCEDVWHHDYTGAPGDGSAWTDGDPTLRVLRGGSWSGSPGGLRSADRARVAPGFRDDNTGFRVARMLTP